MVIKTASDRPAKIREAASFGYGRLLFLGFGDIELSLGARTYICSLVEAFQGLGVSVSSFFFQQLVGKSVHLDGRHTALTIITPPFRNLRGQIPRVLWRFYELVWANWRCLKVALKEAGRTRTCMVTGAGLLFLTPFLRRAFTRLVFVQHGIAEEFLLTPSWTQKTKYWLTKFLERKFLPAFDRVIVVSNKMAEYCQREYGLNESVVIPCCTDPARFEFSAAGREEKRRELKVENRIVFVYSGGAGPWQCLSETVKFYQRARKEIPNASLLVLSRDSELMVQMLKRVNVQDFDIRSVSHDEVPQYLCAADAAFLLRGNSVINTVASPLKFAEYLACGLPVVTSPYVGDYSSIVREQDVGVLVDPDDEATWDSALTNLIRIMQDISHKSRCVNASRDFTWNAMTGRLAKVLDGRAGQHLHP